MQIESFDDSYRTCKSGISAPSSTFALPHSVTVAEDRGIVCVADRENGRIQCFDYVGKLQQVIQAPELRPTLYAVAYDKYSGIESCIMISSPVSLVLYDFCPLCAIKLLLARLMGQYYVARWRLSPVVVCSAAGRRACRRVHGRRASTVTSR